jgi:hypothetical protein
LFGIGHLADLLDLRYAYDLMTGIGFTGGLGSTLTRIPADVAAQAGLADVFTGAYKKDGLTPTKRWVKTVLFMVPE